MAFLRRQPVCYEPGCTKTATEELLTFRNERFGYYCDRHADKALRTLLANEEATKQA